jgi:PKD repeat protein
MQANEWRKDSSGPVLVGSTMRCWEMDVVHENDNLYFSPASFGGSNKVYCYAGVHDTVSFSAYSYVDTNIRSINIQVMDSLPKGASFIIKKAKYPSGYSAYNYFTIGQVCWTPSNKEIGKQPFRICLQAKDTLCPYPDLVQETALLYVIPKPDTIQLSINNAVQCANKNLFQCKVHVNDKAYLCRYRFSYGDSTAVTSDMTHTYARAGSYKITLIVLLGGDTIGIKDTVVNVLQGPPKPDFASYNRKLYCSGTERNMYFQNKTPYDSATTYFWRFSDGKVSFDYNAVHAFPIKPRYGSATLIAKKGTCLDSISYDFRIPQTKTISVAGIHPSLKKTKNCHSYQFYSNLDTTLIDSVTSVTWDFGDGSRPVINVMNPKHTFSSGSTQTYSVNCIVSDGECSLSNSISLTDTVINISISSPDSICAGRAVSFKAVGDVNKVKAKDIKWSFGNGDSASGAAVVYTYLKSGKHKVSISYPDDFCIRASSIDVFMKPWLYPVISGNISPSAGHDTLVYSLDQGVNIKHKWSVISGTLISRPDADTAAIVWYDTLEYSGKVMCDFDTTQCIDRAEFIVYPHSSGLQENVKGNDAFKVYPDPTAGNVMLEFDDQKEHQWQLSIMDVTGKQLYHEVFKGVAGVQRKELSLTAFPPGTYYLKLSSTDHQAVRKLIKL